MYIPYHDIAKIVAHILPEKTGKRLVDWAYNKKIAQNLKYIEQNKGKLLPKLKTKKVLRVAFYIYDETKWKSESLYHLMRKDGRFKPFIFVTKNNCKLKDNPNYQTAKDVEKCYKFFKQRGYKVVRGYKHHHYVPLMKFKPDVVIYQHPWYVETSQGPVVASKYALTCYIPYYIPTTTAPIDYYLRFHQYVERYYVFDELTKNLYQEKMENKGWNVKVTGQPVLDYFRSNQHEAKKYYIYAPHWTICNQGVAYGTFEWNGEFMLKYAQQHPEQEWVFKPHPLLFKSLVKNGVMSEKQARDYYNEWTKVGTVYDMGDYLKIFNQSKLMVTDCSSFLGEFLLTESPVIQLISENSKPFNETIKQIIRTYYKARNNEDLKYLLDNILPDDIMKKQRLQVIEQLGLKDNFAAQNIIDDIFEQIRQAR